MNMLTLIHHLKTLSIEVTVEIVSLLWLMAVLAVIIRHEWNHIRRWF